MLVSGEGNSGIPVNRLSIPVSGLPGAAGPRFKRRYISREPVSEFLRDTLQMRFHAIRAARLVLLLACMSSANADIITFGSIQLAPDNPSGGLLSVLVSNVSGPSVCDASFNSCTSLFIDQGLLTIDYVDLNLGAQTFTANLPDGFGPGDLDPSTFSGFTVDPSNWILSSVTFSGILSPSNLFAFNGDALQIGNTAFSASFLTDETSYALLTTDAQPQTSEVPEPSTLLLTTLAASLLIYCRRN